ncbi:MAG: M56 family metallopeptidase [Pirellulales bacterium]
MDTAWAMEHWPLGVARATACTLLAAGVAQLLLSKLEVRSPRVHRLAWLLVIAQGWLVMTWTWQVEVEREPAPAVPRAVTDHNLSVMVAEPQPPVVATVDDRPATWSLATWSLAAWSFVTTAPATVFAVCWGLGVAVLVGANVWRYAAMVRRLPRGSVPQRADWCDEWQRSTAALGVRRRVVLRISERLGPLLCYLPFTHRVLVPRELWTRLERTEREAILRHELAFHLVRGDLWKSLLVRLVALPQWFNPAVWWAVRRFDEAGEWATDDLARGLTADEELDYARALVLRGRTCPRTAGQHDVGRRRRGHPTDQTPDHPPVQGGTCDEEVDRRCRARRHRRRATGARAVGGEESASGASNRMGTYGCPRGARQV